MLTNDQVLKKWQPLIDIEEGVEIAAEKKGAVAQILENTMKEQALSRDWGNATHNLSEDVPTNATGANVDNFDPVLISLIRRTAPNNIAFDICGVQPMNGPTGLIFALRSHYDTQTGTEAFYNEADTNKSTSREGDANNIGEEHKGATPTGDANTYNFAGGMTTTQSEALGSVGNVAFPEMAFSIDKWK